MLNRCIQCGKGITPERSWEYRTHHFCHTCQETLYRRTGGFIVLGLFLLLGAVVFFVGVKSSVDFGWDDVFLWQDFKSNELPVIKGMIKSGGGGASIIGTINLIARVVFCFIWPVLLLAIMALPLIGILLTIFGISNCNLKKTMKLREEGYWPSQESIKDKYISELQRIADSLRAYKTDFGRHPVSAEELTKSGKLTESFIGDYDFYGGRKGLLAAANVPIFPDAKTDETSGNIEKPEGDLHWYRAILREDYEPEIVDESVYQTSWRG